MAAGQLIGPRMPEEDLAAAAASAPALRQVVALTRWIGPGRKLTQTGQLTMADARHLVGLLETGDEIDPVIGTRMSRTRSSAELPRLAIVVAWAKAVGLLRVVHGRLVPVKKNQRLLDRPAELWTPMFAAFDQLGPALCPPGWFASLLGEDFSDGIAVLLATIAGGGGGRARIEDARTGLVRPLKPLLLGPSHHGAAGTHPYGHRPRPAPRCQRIGGVRRADRGRRNTAPVPSHRACHSGRDGLDQLPPTHVHPPHRPLRHTRP